MLRDATPMPVERVSARTGARFTYLAETIARAYEPTETQLAALQRAYESTGDYLIECPEFDGLVHQVHAHGSRPLGVMVRPSFEREGWDVDLVARLARAALARYGGERGPAALLQHLFEALSRYATRHGLGIERHERCITLIYAGGMRADFAPVIDDPLHAVPFGASHGRIPDRQLRSYLPTNPLGYCQFFDGLAKIRPNFPQLEKLSANLAEARRGELLPLPPAEEVFGRLLSRYVQAGKVHRNVAFSGPRSSSADLKPSSTFITTLTAQGYALEAPKPHDGPLDLLMDIVDVMPFLFERQPLAGNAEYWVIPNPTAPHDNLAASMNERAKQQAFLAWHARFSGDLRELQQAIDRHCGLDELLRLVTRAFGEPAAQAIGNDDRTRRESNRAAGRGVFLAAGTLPVAAAARAHTYFGG